MLVERGMRVINAEKVGDAYAIASNYLRRAGAMADNFVTDERLLEIIVQMFRNGEVRCTRCGGKGYELTPMGEYMVKFIVRHVTTGIDGGGLHRR